jgi:hypothetical protein
MNESNSAISIPNAVSSASIEAGNGGTPGWGMRVAARAFLATLPILAHEPSLPLHQIQHGPSVTLRETARIGIDPLVEPSLIGRLRLERLKARQFATDGRRQRIERAVHELEAARFEVSVSTDVWLWAAQSADVEDL